MIRVRRLFVELWWQKSYWSKFKRKQRKIGDYWHRNLFLGVYCNVKEGKVSVVGRAGEIKKQFLFVFYVRNNSRPV